MHSFFRCKSFCILVFMPSLTRLAIVRPNHHVRFGRHLVSRSTKQAKACPTIALEDVSEHTEWIPPHDLPIIQPGRSRCARILGDTISGTVRTCFGVWVDFGSGAWGFGKYNRGSGERKGQEDHVCGDAEGEDGGHAGGEGWRVECEFEPGGG